MYNMRNPSPNMKIDTALTHLGRKFATASQLVNPPIARASTVLFPSLAAFKASYRPAPFEAMRYGRSGTQTHFELQDMMCALEGAEACLLAPSGLNAIVSVLYAYATSGAHILVSDGVYGPTRDFCESILVASGVQVEFFPVGVDIASLIRENTVLVYIETPASLTMEMLDTRAICTAAHRRNVLVAADCSWGTPLFFHALALGIDISIHAATKYIIGHSDGMLGTVCGSRAALAPVRTWMAKAGVCVNPDGVSLALRGLRTLSVRLERHQRNAMQVANWLSAHSAVDKVLFPALESDHGNALWRRDFSGASSLFTFRLVSCTEEAFSAFFDALSLFGIGTSWGGFESLAMPAIPHSLRSAECLPDAGRLVRLHIGLEDPNDLIDDLKQALQWIG